MHHANNKGSVPRTGKLNDMETLRATDPPLAGAPAGVRIQIVTGEAELLLRVRRDQGLSGPQRSPPRAGSLTPSPASSREVRAGYPAAASVGSPGREAAPARQSPRAAAPPDWAGSASECSGSVRVASSPDAFSFDRTFDAVYNASLNRAFPSKLRQEERSQPRAAWEDGQDSQSRDESVPSLVLPVSKARAMRTAEPCGDILPKGHHHPSTTKKGRAALSRELSLRAMDQHGADGGGVFGRMLVPSESMDIVPRQRAAPRRSATARTAVCARDLHTEVVGPSAFASKDRKEKRSIVGGKPKDPARPTFSWEQKRVANLQEMHIKQKVAARIAAEAPRDRRKCVVPVGGSFGPPMSARESQVPGAKLPPAHEFTYLPAPENIKKMPMAQTPTLAPPPIPLGRLAQQTDTERTLRLAIQHLHTQDQSPSPQHLAHRQHYAELTVDD